MKAHRAFQKGGDTRALKRELEAGNRYALGKLHRMGLDYDREAGAIVSGMSETSTTKEKLEYLRTQIRGECISWGELAELQGLADEIENGDVELLEWAGVSEEDAIAQGRM